MPKKQEVILYTRVSTKTQEESEAGKKGQIDAAVKYAKENDLLIVETINAQVSGGASLEKRKLLCTVISQLNPDLHLLVYNRSRLGRDAMLNNVMEGHIRSRGSKLHTVMNEGGLGDDPVAHLQARMVDVFSEYTRLMIGHSTRVALRAMKQRGEKHNRCVYGFIEVPRPGREGKSNFEPCIREIGVVKRILSAYSRGVSVETISKMLNENEVPSKEGGKWNPGTVYKIMQYHMKNCTLEKYPEIPEYDAPSKYDALREVLKKMSMDY